MAEKKLKVTNNGGHELMVFVGSEVWLLPPKGVIELPASVRLTHPDLAVIREKPKGDE